MFGGFHPVYRRRAGGCSRNRDLTWFRRNDTAAIFCLDEDGLKQLPLILDRCGEPILLLSIPPKAWPPMQAALFSSKGCPSSTETRGTRIELTFSRFPD
jgi:hypothetical protein